MAADGHVTISLSFDASDARQGTRQISQAFDAMSRAIHDSVADANDEVDKLGKGADSTQVEDELHDVGKAAEKAADKLREMERAKDDATDGGGVTGSLLGNLADFAEGFSGGVIDEIKNGTTGLRDHIANKFAPALETLKHIGETLMDTFVFDLMMSALDAAKEKLGEIINADAQLSAQIGTIKGNISTAFAPLWNAVYPAVVKILNGVIAITSAIANLSAKIFGGAKTATGALNAEADAIGAVGEAAGAASQELGGFDEINTLPSSGGGGGSTGGGAAGAELTAGLATDLAYTFEDLYDRLMSINWETVGNKISDALLGIDFEGIGKKITDGVRYLFKSAGTVLRVVAWAQIGGNIAKGLNQITTLLPDLATLLADWFNMQVEFWSGLVAEYDWANLGISIADSIKNFFTGVNWLRVGAAISNLVKGLIEMLINFIANWDSAVIKDAILDLLRGIDWKGLAAELGKLFIIMFAEALEYHTPAGLGIKALNWLGITDFDPSEWLEGRILGDGYSDAASNANELASAENNLVNETTVADATMKMFNASIAGTGDAMGDAAANTNKEVKAAGSITSRFKSLTSGTAKNTTATTKNTAAVKESTKALDDNDKAAASAVMTNAALALSAKNMSTTTADSFVSMDEALDNNLRGWKEYAIQLTSVFMDIDRKQDGFWADMTEAASTAASAVSSSFTRLPETISTAFRKAWGSILTALSGGAGSNLQGITDSLGKVFKSSINQLLGGLDDLFDRVERQLNETIVSLKRTQIGGTKPFANLQMVNLPSIPKLAKGAVIPANNEFLAVLGDQRHGTNIEAPLDTIVEAMEIALQRNGSGSPEAIASAVRAGLAGMAVTFDGERVGRVVAAQIDANRRADGKFAYDLA